VFLHHKGENMSFPMRHLSLLAVILLAATTFAQEQNETVEPPPNHK
jgi:hypothetical protein